MLPREVLSVSPDLESDQYLIHFGSPSSPEKRYNKKMLSYYCHPSQKGTLVLKRWWSQKDKFRKLLYVGNTHKHRKPHLSIRVSELPRIFIQCISNNFAIMKSILYWLGEVVYSLILLRFLKLMFFFICYRFSLYSSSGWPWYSYLRFSCCRIAGMGMYLTEITVN